MKNLIIFILSSLAIITLVGLDLIPQLMVPDYGSETFARRFAVSNPNKGDVKEISTSVSGCAASAYGMDCAITEYLEKTLIQPTSGGKVFCAYDKIGAGGTENVIYLNYSCDEFYTLNGKIYEGSGQAGPAKIIALDNGSLSYWVPRDGSYFTRDIQEFFPAEFQQAAMDSISEKISQINRERGRKYFNADFDYKVEKTTDAACNYDFECATPAEYLMMSRCPFTSKCIGAKCTVICPNFQNLNPS